MKNVFILIFIAVSFSTILFSQTNNNTIITDAWQSGKTLPIEIGKQYQPELLKGIKNDNGYNVLIDIAHQCSFSYMWVLQPVLQQKGYRTVSSQASLHTVLDPNGKCRLRIPFDTKNKIYPFAWHPNFKYNVVITQQADPSSPIYTKEEQKALVKYVKNGGGLIILGNPIKNGGAANWSINELAKAFGAEFTDNHQEHNSIIYSTLSLDEKWEVIGKSKDGSAIQARKPFGKGRIVIGGSQFDLNFKLPKTMDEETKAKITKQKNKYLGDIMDWLCENQEPVGGEPRLPQNMGGGGAIYPELEGGTEGIVVFYAPNINPKLLECVEVEFPKITNRINQWLPSTPTKEPMYLILSAGNGGGWAVNAFKPKENGIISLNNMGVISIYAHELAHTLGGPANSKGEKAGNSPFHNQGEAHAGWFQGKIDAMYRPELLDKATKKCQEFYKTDKFKELDIIRYAQDKEYYNKFGKGADWQKIWCIWQMMDDTYGPTWYPRWKMTQYDRWENDPKRELTWNETIEDMSLAVGEDLFPFFNDLNTSLSRKEMGEIEYKNKKITLPKATIKIKMPGKVNLEDIKDYRNPLSK